MFEVGQDQPVLVIYDNVTRSWMCATTFRPCALVVAEEERASVTLMAWSNHSSWLRQPSAPFARFVLQICNQRTHPPPFPANLANISLCDST